MLFKEFFQVKEVSTCGDLKGSDGFSYPDVKTEYVGDKLGSFSHNINGKKINIGMYVYNYDDFRSEYSAYVWLDEETRKKVAQLSYITLKVKFNESLRKIISEKYFFIVKEYRGNGLLTPIYESVLNNNKVSPNKLVSDIKQSPSMNKFWKGYLIPTHNASVLIASKMGSNTVWVNTNSIEGKREVAKLHTLKKLDRDQKIEPLNDYINGNEVYDSEKFRILIEK